MSNSSTVGVIGLGLLGDALIDRLIIDGYLAFGHDIDPLRTTAITSRGVESCSAAADVFGKSRVVFLCLPTSDVVAATLDAVSAMLNHEHVVVDLTTGEPNETVQIANELESFGAAYIEARVCGSSDQLRQGKAALLLGGVHEQIESLDAVLRSISERTFYVGEVGCASRLKLVHNLILGLNRAALAEGLLFAKSLELDAGRALEILLQTPAASRAMETKGTKMVTGDYKPQATLAQHLKDVELILNEARESSALTPLSELHRELLRRAVELGFGDSDNSAIIEALRSKRE